MMSCSSDFPLDNIKELMDRAIRVTLESFRDEFSKLMGERLDSTNSQICKLESENLVLCGVINELQTAIDKTFTCGHCLC